MLTIYRINAFLDFRLHLRARAVTVTLAIQNLLSTEKSLAGVRNRRVLAYDAVVGLSLPSWDACSYKMSHIASPYTPTLCSGSIYYVRPVSQGDAWPCTLALAVAFAR